MALRSGNVMKVKVRERELYPCYFIMKDGDFKFYKELELTDEEFALIKDAEEKYAIAQKILARAYENEENN